jgi:hypothetical protein
MWLLLAWLSGIAVHHSQLAELLSRAHPVDSPHHPRVSHHKAKRRVRHQLVRDDKLSAMQADACRGVVRHTWRGPVMVVWMQHLA